MKKENDQNQDDKKISLIEKPVSRRDFSRIAMTIGLTSTLFAWDSFTKVGATPSAPMLAQAAKDIEKERTRKKAKYRFRYGAAGHSEDTTWVAKSGSLDFVRELEERSDGEIRVDYLGSNTICGEMDCGEKASHGIIDFYLASTNNASTTFPYLLNLDWGALWQNRAQLYSFAYDYRSELLLREPMRRLYGIEMLFGDYGLRGFFMSKKKYGEGTPAIDTLEKLQKTNAKIRTTGTYFGLESMRLMGVNPVAISYEEVVDAVRQGAIDGAEAWEVPFSMIRFTEYTGQYLYLKYCSGNWVTGANYNKLKGLPTNVQETIMEAAYLTQVMVHGKQEAAIYIKAGSGETENPPVGSEHWVNDIRNVIWSDEEYEKLERLISPKYNPDPWKKHREQQNRLYGKGDIFDEMYAVAREVPQNAYAIDVSPKRWWQPNPAWWTNGVWKRGTDPFIKREKKA
jgi:TRAP-type transport system periplasmic protein